MNEAVRIPVDGRPIVRSRQNVMAPWIFGAVTLIGAAFLYSSLESARESRLAQREAVPANAVPARPLPELAIPTWANADPAPGAGYATRPAVPLQAVPARPVVSPPQIVYRTAPASRTVVTPQSSVPPSAPISYAPPPEPTARAPQPRGPGANGNAGAGGRVVAERLANPSYTVAQGTLIPAVLETALDSSRAGPARAMVSRDVRSFDRERVLIPRGSKLIGEYQAGLGTGQRRAAVTWTRLIRPDGVTIDLRSPASDSLGRAGISGKVNNHTLRRIGDALLQTMVGVGSNITQRVVTQPVIVMSGGSQPPSVNLTSGSQIQPTLTVRQGARINVFVARDLDFASVDDAS